MVTLRQPYREKVSQMVSWGTGSPCSTCCWPWCSAAATFCRRLADDACRTTVFVRQSRRAFQLSGVYQLCADPLSVDLYRGLAAPDALPVGDPCHRRDDAAADRQRGFTRFHLHLNPVVWELVINPDQNEMARDWQLMFISVPVIFLIEMLFATGAGKAAQPDAPPPLRPPGRTVLLLSFVSSHGLYLGGRQFLSPDHYAAGESAALLSDDRPSFP